MVYSLTSGKLFVNAFPDNYEYDKKATSLLGKQPPGGDYEGQFQYKQFHKRFTCICVFLVYVHTMACPVPMEVKEGVGSSGSGVQDGYK